MTKRPSQTRKHTTSNKGVVKQLICTPAQTKKKVQRKRPDQLPSSKAYDAGRSLFDVQHNLLPGLRAEDTSLLRVRRIFEVEPLLVVPGLIRGSQPNACRDNVDGPVAH